VAVDFTYRLRTPHRPGQLAGVTGAIAEQAGLIGDIDTLNVGREASIREITVEVRDEEHAERVAAELGELDGVEVLWFGDRARGAARPERAAEL
jgi:malate dehydrogenase (oxaloacetate-decarboxylating)